MTMRRLVVWLLLASLLIVGCTRTEVPKNEARAHERAVAFAQAVNYEYETPEKIYPYLTAAFKEQMSEDEFVEAFNKERSYPYLVPLFINFREVVLDEAHETGTAYYSQAARLPGMIYEVGMEYENGDYYFRAFDPFLDGSYLEKFEVIPYSLDMYYDIPPQEDAD